MGERIKLMERQILLEQMDDRVRKGLAVVIELYGRLINEGITEEEMVGLLDTTYGLSVIFKAIHDINNGNFNDYKDLVYTLAKGVENE